MGKYNIVPERRRKFAVLPTLSISWKISGISQKCGKSNIFLELRFYVRSILENLNFWFGQILAFRKMQKFITKHYSELLIKCVEMAIFDNFISKLSLYSHGEPNWDFWLWIFQTMWESLAIFLLFWFYVKLVLVDFSR